MNRVYIETDKRKCYLSYADVVITHNKDIIIGFKKSLMTFEYSEKEKIYQKFYDIEEKTEKSIFEVLKKITVNDKTVYQIEEGAK